MTARTLRSATQTLRSASRTLRSATRSRAHISRALALGMLALGLGVAGCRKEEKKPDAPAASATAPAKKGAKPVDEGVEVPTEEDFEEAVAKQITPESDLQKELDQLDKEIH